MSKITLENKTTVYPMPAFIIGATVDGKPNFMTAAWSGIAGSVPPMITVAIRHSRHTLKGILQNQAFSVNVPSAAQARETDYCGVASGAKTDKVADCDFKVFSGKLKSAPMIEQCPVNLECAVAHMLNVGSHMLIVGEIKETYISDDCLTDGRPDADKINPLIFIGGPDGKYRRLGISVASAFSVGTEIKPKKK
jgi:flavin reductase (DIM6/NTAB) family NADH-FMN oxidoreductase RutF